MFSVLMLATTTPILATTTPMVATSALQLQQQQKEAAQSEEEKKSQTESTAGPSASSASSGPSIAVSSSSGPSETRSGAVSPEFAADSQKSSTKPASNVSFIRNKVFALAATASKSATDAHRKRLGNNPRVFISGQRIVLDDASKASSYEPSNFQLQQQGDEDILFTTTRTGSLDDVHVDSGSYQVLVGSREEHAHIREPMAWDLLPNEEGGLVLKARKEFVAVEEGSGVWVLYFDVEGDKLKNRRNVRSEAVPVDLMITAGSA